jgi:glutathione S-transferase
MISVHHLNSSRSQRVLWLLEELALPYEIVRYQRDPQTMMAPASLRDIHPLGKSPVITDGATTLAESGAIVEYLVEQYGNGRLAPPADSPARVRYLYWLHYAEGSAMPPLVMKFIFDRMVANPAASALIEPQLKLHLDYQEAELGKSLWFAGAEFSAADIQMSGPIEAARSRDGMDASHLRLSAFLDRIRARPAYQRALEKGAF